MKRKAQLNKVRNKHLNDVLRSKRNVRHRSKKQYKREKVSTYE